MVWGTVCPPLFTDFNSYFSFSETVTIMAPQWSRRLTKTPPVPFLIFGFNKGGLKGRLFLFLFDLSSERLSDQLTLQLLKVCPETGSDECLTLLYDFLRGAQGLVGWCMDPCLVRVRVSQAAANGSALLS